MKKILFILLILLLPNMAYAEDFYLNDLKILNGVLSLPFDSLNTEYTVELAETEFQIDFDYKVSEDVTVSVMDNYDLENDSIVTLILSKDDKKLEYHFHVLKDEAVSTFHYDLENGSEQTDHFMYKYKLYIIPSVCLFLIIIVHKILFRKHKKKII